MLTRGVHIKLVIFVVAGLLAIGYISVKYIGFDLLGSSGYRVTASLPAAGGAFENGEVTYRGVPVGRIAELRATEEGAEAVLRINEDAPPIPADSEVVVANRSAIGEQYVDLRGSSGGETLSDGDRLEGSVEGLPPDPEDVVRVGRDFVESVPSDALNTVIDEGYELFQGAGEPLSRLVDTSHDFARTADANFLVTASLIEESNTVLATQQESSASIRGFSRDLNLLAASMADSDQQWRELISTTPAAAQEMGTLFEQVGQPLGTLMGNLVAPAEVFGQNAAGVRDTMIRLPGAMSIGYSITGSRGLELGLATTFFDPIPCTRGYGGTPLRAGLDTGEGRAFNTDAGCTMPPSSGVNVRGPRSVPGGGS